MKASIIHKPVMVHEVVHYLRCARGGLFVDGTLGTGGHTLAILQHSPATTRVIGIDRDPEGLAVARERLAPFSHQLQTVQGKFGDLKIILSGLGVRAVDGILLDLGFSSLQIESPGRGFSFQRDDPLDMRMDQTQGISARDWLAHCSQKELIGILKEYGEERWAKRLTGKILAFQSKGPVETTRELAELIAGSIPRGGRIHPATRTFQALRILINDELTQLKSFLGEFLETLKDGGRVCLISYHSLEDRLIKQAFLRLERGLRDPLGMSEPVRPEGQPGFKRLISKPTVPSQIEMQENPRSRGAKLRVGERVGGPL
ncbi:MAG: 16S rRNA (cytosine(1402)-N(4))-methyltransferase RsmH [Deltaproteobacteria bacterium]|nr:16S rRNA (cytosine(1402)-N(4))-methyltransferase RsmH [Deltaproteobacteria bacterium]